MVADVLFHLQHLLGQLFDAQSCLLLRYEFAEFAVDVGVSLYLLANSNEHLITCFQLAPDVCDLPPNIEALLPAERVVLYPRSRTTSRRHCRFFSGLGPPVRGLQQLESGGDTADLPVKSVEQMRLREREEHFVGFQVRTDARLLSLHPKQSFVQFFDLDLVPRLSVG
jgi:hypothetical protein